MTLEFEVKGGFKKKLMRSRNGSVILKQMRYKNNVKESRCPKVEGNESEEDRERECRGLR